MNVYPYLAPWLQCLDQLVPPQGLIHVGAGDQHANGYPFSSMPRLLVVEADATLHSRLMERLQDHSCCTVVQGLVSNKKYLTDYLRLNKSSESGLFPQSELQSLWPSIKTIGAEQVQTTTIQDLLNCIPADPSLFNWVFIDCLPAGNVIQGAGRLHEHWDVLLLRAIKDTHNCVGPNGAISSLEAISEMLESMGLRCVSQAEESHPSLVRALFVRNQKLRLNNLKTVANEAASEKAALVLKIEAELKAKNEALTQCSTLAQANEFANSRCVKLATENSQVTEKNSLLLQSLEMLRVELAATASLVLKYEEQTVELSKLAKQLDDLSAEILNIEADRDKFRSLADMVQKSMVIQQQELEVEKQRADQLDEDNKAIETRQNLLKGELIKAEIQIELIKDIFLRQNQA